MVYEMACKEICFSYKAKSDGKNRYSNNQKRCQTCEILSNGMDFGVLVVAIC